MIRLNDSPISEISLARNSTYHSTNCSSSQPLVDYRNNYQALEQRLTPYNTSSGDSIIVSPYIDPNSGQIGHMVMRKAEDVGKSYDSSLLKDLDHFDSFKGLDQTIKSLEKIKAIDDSFLKAGKFDRIIDYANKHGLKKFQKEKAYAAVSKGSNAIMFTLPNTSKYTVIGTNADLVTIINQAKSKWEGSTDELIEYALTHEYFHNLQKDWIFKELEFFVESDNDLRVSKFFFELAKNKINAARYDKLSKIAYGRHVEMLEAYRETFAVNMTDEEFKDLIEGSSMETIIRTLKGKATKTIEDLYNEHVNKVSADEGTAEDEQSAEAD